MWRTRPTTSCVVVLIAVLLAGCGSGSVSNGPAAGAEARPVTIEHTFGTTTVPARPSRVVTVTNRDTDTVLALGVVPVGIHSLYQFPSGVGPWAEGLLETAKPVVWTGRELNYEAIAAVRPDLIINTSGSDDAAVYQTLARIAPTIGLPKGQVSYGATAESSVPLIAAALGDPDAGRRVLDGFADYLAAQKASHPRFATMTATYLDIHPSGITAYSEDHVVNAVLARLGFRMTSGSTGIPAGRSSQPVSAEDLTGYAADVMIVYPFGRTLPELEQQVPTLASLDATRNGRLFVATDLAFSASSVLSLRYGLDRLLAEISRSPG